MAGPQPRDIPSPEGLDFTTWASRLVEGLGSRGLVAFPPADETQWRSWAGEIYYQGDLWTFDPPRPEVFDTWQAWATWVRGSLC